MAKRLVEQPEGPFLQLLVEVDHHVATADELGFGEHRVGSQAMVGEGDVFAQRAVEQGGVVGGRVVVGESALAAGRLVIGGVGAHVLERENAFPGFFQRLRVDVGRVNEAALQQAFFLQQDGERIHFLAGAAARDPDLQRGVGSEHRGHMLAQADVVRGVAEHFRDGDGQVLQQLAEGVGLVQHARLQLRDGGAAHFTHGVQHAAFLRSAGVVAEVVAVPEEDRLHQHAQLDVDAADLCAVAHHTVSRAGIHTRSNEYRRDRSIGLAR